LSPSLPHRRRRRLADDHLNNGFTRGRLARRQDSLPVCRTQRRRNASGRGRLPVCVTRIRSVLAFMSWYLMGDSRRSTMTEANSRIHNRRRRLAFQGQNL
jgi:hypothetical protein